MRGSEVNINLSEMKEWTSALKSSDTMKIIALENGDIAMGAELRKSMSEKMADAWKIKLYATDDMKILAVHPDINSDFRYPKNGRRKFKSYVESLKNKGYKICQPDFLRNEKFYFAFFLLPFVNRGLSATSCKIPTHDCIFSFHSTL